MSAPVMGLTQYVVPAPIIDLLDANRAFIKSGPIGKAVGVIERLSIATLGFVALQSIAASYSTTVTIGAFVVGAVTLSIPAGVTILGASLLQLAAAKAAFSWSLFIAVPAFLGGVYLLDNYNVNIQVPIFGSGFINELVFG